MGHAFSFDAGQESCRASADEGVRLLPALTGSAKVGRIEFDELGTPEDGVV